MNKQKVLKFVNFFLFLSVLFTIISIIIYRFIPGELQGSELIYNIHQTAGTLFFFIAIAHVILNWKWISINYFKKKEGK